MWPSIVKVARAFLNSPKGKGQLVGAAKALGSYAAVDAVMSYITDPDPQEMAQNAADVAAAMEQDGVSAEGFAAAFAPSFSSMQPESQSDSLDAIAAGARALGCSPKAFVIAVKSALQILDGDVVINGVSWTPSTK